MPQVVREDIDNLNAILTVTVEKAEYEPKFKKELNKYKSQAHMKGFRKGKTPISVLKKMYGKGILADIINQELQESVMGYIRDNDLDILGQPIPNEDQEAIDFDLRDLDDYEFKFEIGLAPEFDLAGLDESNVFEKYKVTIPEATIQEEIENARKRLGEMVFAEEKVTEEDLIKFQLQGAEETSEDTEEAPHEFSVPFDRLTEEAQKSILDQTIGEVFSIDLSKLEKEVDETYSKRYFLKIEDEEAEVDFTQNVKIVEASHVEPAVINEEFYQKMFNNDEITTEEQAKEEIEKSLVGIYDEQATALLYRDFQENLMEQNDIPLPDGFLKKWIKASNENLSEADVEREYDPFAKNLQWSMISGKISKDAEVEVTEADLKAAFTKRVQGYLGNSPGLGDEFISSMVDRLMGDENQLRQVHDEVMGIKIQEAITAKVGIKDKAIELDDFIKILEKAREEAQAAQQPQLVTEEE